MKLHVFVGELRKIYSVSGDNKYLAVMKRWRGSISMCLLSVKWEWILNSYTVYPKKYAHGFVVLCFVVVMQSFIMNSHEVFIHIRQGCFAGTGAIVRLPQCQWSKPDGYRKISQCITTTKQKPCAYFLGYTVHLLCVAFDVVWIYFFVFVVWQNLVNHLVHTTDLFPSWLGKVCSIP